MEIFLKDLKYAIKRAKGQNNSKYDNEKKIFDNAGELSFETWDALVFE